jgi:autotransporter-associated beta strand protein
VSRRRIRAGQRLIALAVFAAFADEASWANYDSLEYAKVLTNGAVSLTSGSNWSQNVSPNSTYEAELPIGGPQTNLNLGIGNSNQSYGDLLINCDAAYNIGNYGGGSSTTYALILAGGVDFARAHIDGAPLNEPDLLLLGSSVAAAPAASTTVTIGNNVGATPGTGVLNLALGTSGDFDVVNPGATLSITSSISGPGVILTKTGAGTVILSGTGTYTGGTNVSAGTLRVDKSTGVGSALVTVAVGATLGGNGSVGAVTVNGTIKAGPDDNTIGVLTSTGLQTWAGGGGYEVKATGASADKLMMTGGLYVSATSDDPFTITANNTSAGSLTPGQRVTIATDAVTTNGNPFAGVNQTLVLSPDSTAAATGDSLMLSTGQDAGGYELYLSDVVGAPEPASLLLLGVAIAPLALGRRRPAMRR